MGPAEKERMRGGRTRQCGAFSAVREIKSYFRLAMTLRSVAILRGPERRLVRRVEAGQRIRSAAKSLPRRRQKDRRSCANRTPLRETRGKNESAARSARPLLGLAVSDRFQSTPMPEQLRQSSGRTTGWCRAECFIQIGSLLGRVRARTPHGTDPKHIQLCDGPASKLPFQRRQSLTHHSRMNLLSLYDLPEWVQLPERLARP